MSDKAVTRSDIDEVLDLMRTFMNQVDEKFTGVEVSINELKQTCRVS